MNSLKGELWWNSVPYIFILKVPYSSVTIIEIENNPFLQSIKGMPGIFVMEISNRRRCTD